MLGKLYTKVHDLTVLGLQETSEKLFTPEEHSLVVQRELGPFYESRESLLRHSLTKNVSKLETFPFVTDFVRKNCIKTILSIGSGDCTLEHLLAYSLGDIDGLKVCATEFDEYLVAGARRLYDNIQVEKYDVFKDNLPSFQKAVGLKFDLVIFYGSAYVMDNQTFITQFRQFQQAEVKYVMDFHAGYLSFVSAWKALAFETMYRFPRLRSMLASIVHKNSKLSQGRGKFHGYWRDRTELLKLYRRAGWRRQKTFSLPNSYAFIAVLQR